MIGGIITVLIVLALTAAIWGRGTAKGCAGWLVASVIAFVVLLALAAMGIDGKAIGLALRWGGVALVLWSVASIAFGAVENVRHHARVERRKKHRANRERRAAYEKYRVDEAAQLILQAERERRLSAPRRLCESLSAADIIEAHNICRHCAWDYDTVAVECRCGSSGDLITWSQSHPPIVGEIVDETRMIRYSDAERDAMLQEVMLPLEEATGASDGSEERAACALLALSGFGAAVVGDINLLRRRATRLMHGAVWLPSSSQERRVVALVALGLFGSECMTDDDVPLAEPLGDYLRDDDPEVRAAAAFAIGQRLLPWLNLDESAATAREIDASLPTEMQSDVKSLRHAYEERGKLYIAMVADLLCPLLEIESDERVRATAAHALAGVEVGSIRAALRRRATATNEAQVVRDAAAVALRPSIATHAESQAGAKLSDALMYLNLYRQRRGGGTTSFPSAAQSVAVHRLDMTGVNVDEGRQAQGLGRGGR